MRPLSSDYDADPGVTEVEFLGYPDGVLEYSLGMRRDIARAIRRRQPDAVVIGSWDVEFAAGLNQAGHRVAGLATLDAGRDAGNRWVFPELLEWRNLPFASVATPVSRPETANRRGPKLPLPGV